MPRYRIGAFEHVHEAVRLHRLRLPLEGERLYRLDPYCVPNKEPRLCTDENLARSCRLFEPGGVIDGVSCHERLSLAAHDHLAGVHADPRFEAMGCHRVAHLRGSACGTECVVLVRNRDAEDRHDGVAHELLDRPAMALDDRAQVLEVAAHPRAERLGIGRLAEARRAHEVAEEYGDDLAGLPFHRLECRPLESGVREDGAVELAH
jgi:hypothetical protein